MKTIRLEIIGCGYVTEVMEVCPSKGVSAARTTWVMDKILKNYRNGIR